MNRSKHCSTNLTCCLPDKASNKSGGSGSVLLVVPVRRSDDDSVVADVVAVVAENLDLGSGDDTESLVAVCIAKGNDCARSANVLKRSRLSKRRGMDSIE